MLRGFSAIFRFLLVAALILGTVPAYADDDDVPGKPSKGMGCASIFWAVIGGVGAFAGVVGLYSDSLSLGDRFGGERQPQPSAITAPADSPLTKKAAVDYRVQRENTIKTVSTAGESYLQPYRQKYPDFTRKLTLEIESMTKQLVGEVKDEDLGSSSERLTLDLQKQLKARIDAEEARIRDLRKLR